MCSLQNIAHYRIKVSSRDLYNVRLLLISKKHSKISQLPRVKFISGQTYRHTDIQVAALYAYIYGGMGLDYLFLLFYKNMDISVSGLARTSNCKESLLVFS